MRIRRICAAVVATAAAFALTACSSAAAPSESASPSQGAAAAADLTLTTVDGERTIDAVPERVVVLDYASLDTLNAVGKSDVVVGTATKSLPESLKSYADVENVGTLKEPDFEAIAGLDPDLIIISARLAEQAPQLEEIAPTVNLSSDSKNWLESVNERAVDLAALFGEEAAAQERVDEITAAADELRGKAGEAGKTMFVMSSGGKLSTYGPGGRYGFVFDDLGFVSADEAATADEARHGKEISFEYIGDKNPAQLLVIDRDAAIGSEGQAAEQVLDNTIVNATDAAKNDRITYLDAASWYLVGGGLDTTKSMIDELSAAIGG
ncbi:siderophore ABC transporter substrate-binding protein [Gulosibacter hominis]|uniref:siderophore ABC transporter substrate-binding protein n=1 Tax=Gulosibacter hominis TaxID=2770504 RepID=UPI001918639E|nr:ABC transporter substrate-binding protein [Gulosibacter hominis]